MLTIYRVVLRNVNKEVVFTNKYYLAEHLAMRRANRLNRIIERWWPEVTNVTVENVEVTTNETKPIIGVMYSSPNTVEFYGAHYKPDEANRLAGTTSNAVGETVRVARLRLDW